MSVALPRAQHISEERARGASVCSIYMCVSVCVCTWAGTPADDRILLDQHSVRWTRQSERLDPGLASLSLSLLLLYLSRPRVHVQWPLYICEWVLALGKPKNRVLARWSSWTCGCVCMCGGTCICAPDVCSRAMLVRGIQARESALTMKWREREMCVCVVG